MAGCDIFGVGQPHKMIPRATPLGISKLTAYCGIVHRHLFRFCRLRLFGSAAVVTTTAISCRGWWWGTLSVRGALSAGAFFGTRAVGHFAVAFHKTSVAEPCTSDALKGARAFVVLLWRRCWKDIRVTFGARGFHVRAHGADGAVGLWGVV